SVVPNRQFLSRSRPIKVRAARIDELVAKHQIRGLDLIKIDVEGFEAAVLRGAWSTLRDHQPVLIVEHSEAWWSNAGFDGAQLRRDLYSIGYQDVFLARRRRSPSRVPAGSPLPTGNLLLVPTTRRSSIGIANLP